MALSINIAIGLVLTSTVALLASSPPSAVAEMDCSTVVRALMPCYGYVVGRGGEVPAPCCGGLKYLVRWDYRREDVQAACACLKSVFNDVDGQQMRRAMDIPWKCGVNLGFQIGGDMRCDTIQ